MAAETTQSLTSEHHPLASMIEDFKNQNIICSPDVSRIENETKSNHKSNNFSYPKRKFGKEERSYLPTWC